MTRPRRVPEWPESLRLKPNPEGAAMMVSEAEKAGIHLTVAPLAFTMEALPERIGDLRAIYATGSADGVPREAPITAIALGTLKDGRHAALELTIQDREVVSAVLLLAATEADAPAEAFREVAYLRLYARQKATTGHPLDLAQLRDGSAIALPTWKGKPAAIAFDFEGRTVTEPKVVATGDRVYAWGALETWAACNLLPRGRR